MKFCENPLCVFHLEGGENNRLRRIIGAREVEVRQFTIVDSATGRRLRFCEVCANAVAMANEQPKHETDKREEGHNHNG
jgi:hypothetical protein